ncbi:hypothetical protein CAPTEDRAFT_207498 [Capitella teleta]|uniref:Uncharacterized protein n=1 Tax=Capitella teleta TaxID=283909 RepID=R7UUR3_CAPTE|nr:hypothetical protein CAPTEDRAFT_207498 [Capitella teleta]|eukprot:ELU07662.1 hypothetical protein CAPTEDRAFT_207498 [Capitella teleta]
MDDGLLKGLSTRECDTLKIGIAFSADGSNCLLQLIAQQFSHTKFDNTSTPNSSVILPIFFHHFDLTPISIKHALPTLATSPSSFNTLTTNATFAFTSLSQNELHPDSPCTAAFLTVLSNLHIHRPYSFCILSTFFRTFSFHTNAPEAYITLLTIKLFHASLPTTNLLPDLFAANLAIPITDATFL